MLFFIARAVALRRMTLLFKYKNVVFCSDDHKHWIENIFFRLNSKRRQPQEVRICTCIVRAKKYGVH